MTTISTDSSLSDQLLAAGDSEAQQLWLRHHADEFDDQDAEALRQESLRLLRSDIQASLRIAGHLIHLADLSGNDTYRALGLWAEAHARALALAEYDDAIRLYDKAASIFQVSDDPIREARAVAGKVYPLSVLGRNDEALQIGESAADVLRDNGEQHSLATQLLNLGVLYGRLGRDEESLRKMDEARKLYLEFGGVEEPNLALIEMNRGILLRNLGEFDASILAGSNALNRMVELGQTVEAARAQQNLAMTYLVQGKYNQSLQTMAAAREAFMKDGRTRDAVLLDVYISECLLQLGRFEEALEKTREARRHFSELGTGFEVGQALLNEAIAFAGLGEFERARGSIREARNTFQAEGNDAWRAIASTEQAVLIANEGKYRDCSRLAIACADFFQTAGLQSRAAYALLVAARAELTLGQLAISERLVRQASELSESLDVPLIQFRLEWIRADIDIARGVSEEALSSLERAITHLEQMVGRVMIEFRADYLEDKAAIYEDAVALCIDMKLTNRGFEYAERAKSRSLLNMLAHHIDLGIDARNSADDPLVAEIRLLRRERDRLLRRQIESGLMWSSELDQEGSQNSEVEISVIEKTISGKWHDLLVRNADYARDASVWQSRSEPIQSYLDSETCLLEFFVVRDELVAFFVEANHIEVKQLGCSPSDIDQWLSLLRLNFISLSESEEWPAASLLANSTGILEAIYELLLSPFQHQLGDYKDVILIPHGVLHYVPFHALLGNDEYLVERHNISYLPSASLLHYLRSDRSGAKGMVAIGHSGGGILPNAVMEANSVAELLGGDVLLESQATVEKIKSHITNAQIVHFASHGDFRDDNPLFSGLALADGWLTTLDIFDLNLDASLVVLSACESGRSVVRAGDELLGLTRAFLHAGASSLLLSLWAVEDQSTSIFMQRFYSLLSEGASKSSALRATQQEFATYGAPENYPGERSFEHPYYWAPFFLVGDNGTL